MNEPLVTDTKISKKMKEANNFITRQLGFIGIVVISVVYIFWGFFTPVLKDQTFWEIILSSTVSILIAVSISNLFSAQGIISGTMDDDVIKMKKAHIESVDSANPFVQYSDEWADEENRIALKSARTHILISAGLKYDLLFDDDGNFLDMELPVPQKNAPKYIKKRYQDKQNAIKKSLTYQITPISMSRISAETSVDLDPNRLAKEPSDYQKAKAVQSLWTRVLSAAIFGRIAWDLIDSESFLESFFNGALQLTVFLLFGIAAFYQSYIYMTTTYINNLRKKINFLRRLVVFGTKKQKMEVIPNGQDITRL